MNLKPVIVRVKYGKGKNAKIKEWRFKTRNSAEIFSKTLLKYNPKCTIYLIMD
jgi:hypothetical protein